MYVWHLEYGDESQVVVFQLVELLNNLRQIQRGELTEDMYVCMYVCMYVWYVCMYHKCVCMYVPASHAFSDGICQHADSVDKNQSALHPIH